MRQEINEIKDRLINKLLLLTLFNLSFALIFSLMRWFDIGFHLTYIFQGSLYTLLVFTIFLRKKLSFSFKSHFLVSIYLFVAVAGLYFVAHYSAFFWILISVSMAAILLGRKTAFYYAILFLAIYIPIGWLHITNRITIQPDLNIYAHLPTVWVSWFVGLLTLFIILIEGFGLFYNELIHSVKLRITATDKLHESETFRSQVFDSSRMPIVVMDADTFRYIDCNPAAVSIYGYTSKDQVLGLTPADVSAPAQYDGTASAEKALFYIEKAKNEGSVVFEWKHQRPDGVIWDAEVHLLSFSTGDKPLLQFSLLDITDRKLSEDKLRESEARYRFITRNIADVIWTLSFKTGKFTYVSPSVVKLRGYTVEEVMNQSMEEALTPESMQIATDLIKNSIARRKSGDARPSITTSMLDQPCKDGSVVSTEVVSTIVFDEHGQPVEAIGITRNITERKRAEEELIKAKEKAEESDRLKTAFLQNMSHEIRTPLNAIMGFSSLLSSNFDDKEKLKSFSKIIEQRGNDLLDIVNDVLDISKIESGQSTIHLENYDINILFAELGLFFNDYKERTNKHEINLQFHTLSDKSVSRVKTDISKLKQILINLVSNAFKFTEIGSINCGYKLENNKLQFYVSDTGVGISSDKHEFIFERFSRIETVVTKNLVGGTGLGLSIVKGLVHLLGGDIWLKSEVNKGSTFYFTIDYIKADSPNIKNPDLINKQELVTEKTILIVEDDFYNAAYLKEVLGNVTSNILTVANGLSAVKIVQEQKIDLILMDIRLPDISGYEATHLILKDNPKMKIIAQTAYAANTEHQKAIEAGCLDYISKPTKQEYLLTLLNKHLK